MNKKIRVLHELWVCFVGGYAGIPQDTRTIFHALSDCDKIQLEGLLYLSRIPFPLRKKLSKHFNSEKFLTEFQKQCRDSKPQNAWQRFLFRALRGVELVNILLKNHFDLALLDPGSKDLIWRETFAKTISPADKASVMKKDFYFSDISSRDALFAAHYGRNVFLNTEPYDFVLFPDVRAIQVSPNTKKIIRYHDSFAFICPDFFQTNHSKMHLNSLKACVADGSYFACNSQHTRDTLVEVFPEVEKRTHVVPLAIQPYERKINAKKFQEICLKHLSTQVCGEEELQPVKDFLRSHETFDYILSLSTLEPRKNYIGLIRAWEKLNAQHKKDIKLVIVANKGWLSQDIEEAMRPHIKAGDMIHLRGVSAEDVPYLYSHAKLFAYLSFLEGFGIPPLEAMHCGTPVLASDNPTHKWSMGDSACYVDPYDTDDIARGMAKLIYDEDAPHQCRELQAKSHETIKRYSIETIKNEWAALFEKLKN